MKTPSLLKTSLANNFNHIENIASCFVEVYILNLNNLSEKK